MKRLSTLTIRWRLALTSAGLTFAILLLFAVIVGSFTERRLAEDFDNELRATAADLQQKLRVTTDVFGKIELAQREYLNVPAPNDATVRVVADGAVLADLPNTPELGSPTETPVDVGDYRVVSRPLFSAEALTPVAYVQYAEKKEKLEATVARLRVFLLLGVAGGSALALLAGLAVARRAMNPIADLTRAARGIARTRDPGARLPKPAAKDEVGALAQTLDEMLEALDEARRSTEATLAREREFVADASHELRTPLTSIFANLELLEAGLDGEDRETAASALRSSRRMRRLVGDLLLLARADAGRALDRQVVDLGAVVRAAVAEAGPAAEDHEVSVSAPEDAFVDGSADDLHRVVLNLVENAVQHTPPGTAVRAEVRQEDAEVVLEVSDSGGGVPPAMRERIFERFVTGDGAGSSRGSPGTGLGLAIVRAVAERHGGSVEVSEAHPGTRFTVRLPAAASAGSRAAADRHEATA